MANLTGDFDVIAQFAVPAVNRVLAAMHRVERFPHSMALRVDDTPQPTHDFHPVILGVIDVFGDPPADHTSIRNPRPVNIADFPVGSANGRLAAALDAIANRDLLGIHLPEIEPSNIKGKAQVQVFPPTIELNDPSGKSVTVRMELIARYLPDSGTSPVAEFVRGELKISAAINQVITQGGRTIYIDVRGPSTNITFTPSWSSVPIGLEDMLGINLLIRNALRTGFLPSNSELGANVGHIQFKPMMGSPGSVALLLDMNAEDAPGNPATANQSFISGSDGFSVGIGADYMRAAFKSSLDQILQEQIPPVSHRFGPSWAGYRVTYTFTLVNASLEFENGKMVLVIVGQANTSSFLPNFNFTARQDMTLHVIGDTAEIQFGAVSLTANKTLVNAAMWFLGYGGSAVATARDNALAENDTQQQIRDKLSAKANFGDLLQSMLKPASGTNDVPPLDVTLLYTSSEIRTTGIILHGSVTVEAAPPPRVEYEPITPVKSNSPHPLPTDVAGSGPDYSALKSWIPGGTIERFEWHRQGSQGYSDTNRFVLLHQGLPSAAVAIAGTLPVAGYSPMCLTIHGRRLSTSGPVVNENVAATVCGYHSFPVGDFAVDAGDVSMIALARRGSGGMVEVVGHAPAMSRSSTAASPNLVIHFADEVSGERLGDMVTALSESKRADAATALIVAAKASRIERLPYSEIVTYAEDDGSLRRQYGVSPGGAATVVVDPAGKVVWKSEGGINPRELGSALGKVLVKSSPPKTRLLSAAARIDQRAANFLFEVTPGHALTLRKAGRRKIFLVFFNNLSQPSLHAIRDAVSEARASNAMVLAIGDSDKSKRDEIAPAILVPDTKKEIAKAYGVTMWPTIVAIDERGIVRSIGYGRLTTGEKSRA